MEIWEPKPPGTLWATPGLLRESFTFLFYIFQTDLLSIIRSLNTLKLRHHRCVRYNKMVQEIESKHN